MFATEAHPIREAQLPQKLSEILGRFHNEAHRSRHNPFMHNHYLHDDASRRFMGLIRAKLDTLVGKFPNGHIHLQAELGMLCAEFRPHGEFSIPASLCIELSTDEVRGLAQLSAMTLSPVPVPGAERLYEIGFSLLSPDTGKLEEFLDMVIVHFAENYLHAHEQFAAADTAMHIADPVCGVRMHRIQAASSLDYMGKSYSFCSKECVEKFLLAPSMYTQRLSSK